MSGVLIQFLKMDRIEFSDGRPLWVQIEIQLRWLIAAGEFSPGDMLPSVRDLASTLGVNPATVHRAYRQLRAEGLLVVKRGRGTFVRRVTTKVTRQEWDRLRSEALSFATVAAGLGISSRDAREIFDAALREVFDPEMDPGG